MESAIQSKILRYLNSLPECIAENVKGNASQSGRADINACYKGHCLKLELKDPKDTGYGITQQQSLYLLRWAKAGAITGTCYSVDDVKRIIQQIDKGVFE